MNKETIEEAAKNYAKNEIKNRGNDNDKLICSIDFIEGAKWMEEQMYSEADMREAYFTAISATGEGWNGEHAGNGSLSIEKAFNEGYEMFIEQYKKK
jgi:CRISPR/Cas system-associated endonuclease Cas1